jgi:uncharacterized membrane protein
MRTLFILTFAANLLLAIVSLAVLPDKVASHFGADGRADDWAPAWVNALIMLVTNGLLFCMLYFTPRLMFAVPAGWLSLPNKRYWLREENRPKAAVIMSLLMWEFGIAFFVFMFVVGALVIEANLSDPVQLNQHVFWAALTLFLAYTVWFCVKCYRVFRIPNETTLQP